MTLDDIEYRQIDIPPLLVNERQDTLLEGWLSADARVYLSYGNVTPTTVRHCDGGWYATISTYADNDTDLNLDVYVVHVRVHFDAIEPHDFAGPVDLDDMAAAALSALRERDIMIDIARRVLRMALEDAAEPRMSLSISA